MKRTLKQKLAGVYMVVSLVMLAGATEESTILGIVVLIANMAFASFCYSRVTPRRFDEIKDNFYENRKK